MPNWQSFNRELKRRNSLARKHQLNNTAYEANLALRAKKAQNYINASWDKSQQAAWAAKSSEEKRQHYRDGFFLNMIDGKLYLQSSEDGALTDYNGTFIGYSSEHGIAYTETPYQPYDDTDVWEQNEYGQYYIIHNYQSLEDDIREAEEMNPGVLWGEPRISEEVQQKMNAVMWEREAEIVAEKKKSMIKALKKETMKKALLSSNNGKSNLEGLLGGRRRIRTHTRTTRRKRRSKH